MNIVKKIKEGLQVACVSVLMSATIIGGSVGAVNLKYSNYLSSDEKIALADKLDADIGYLKTCDYRLVSMQHNGDRPIYVCLDEALNDQEREYAVESLDYLFGILSEINDHYRYQLVDKDTYEKQENSTRILYTVDTEDRLVDVYANANNNINFITAITNKRLSTDHTICLNRQRMATLDDLENKYVYLHELLHLVTQFNDVYTVGKYKTTHKYFGNTIMNDSARGKYVKISPNDIKCMIISCVDDRKSEQELQDIVNKYTDEFYNKYADTLIDKVGFNGKLDGDMEFEASRIIVKTDQDVYGYIYNVEIEDDKYLLTIKDKDTNRVLDQTSGDVLSRKGLLILRDVSLKLGMRPNDQIDCYEGGWVSDLVLGEKDGKVSLYNYLDNDFISGRILELEKNMMQ